MDCCLSAKGVRFEIVYGVSNNTWRFWDITQARRVLGYAPRDNAETYRIRETRDGGEEVTPNVRPRGQRRRAGWGVRGLLQLSASLRGVRRRASSSS